MNSPSHNYFHSESITHDQFVIAARVHEAQPHEQLSEYEDSRILNRITAAIGIGMAVFVIAFFAAQFAFHQSHRGGGVSLTSARPEIAR